MPETKKIYIDRTRVTSGGNIIAKGEAVLLAGKELGTYGALMVYLYMLTIVPDTYEGEINKKNTRYKLYELSPQAIEDFCGLPIKTSQRGIDKLVEKGYLTLEIVNGEERYQFIDVLPKHKTQTPEEYKQVSDYKEEIRQRSEQMLSARQEQLRNIAQQSIEEENILEQDFSQYDWN